MSNTDINFSIDDVPWVAEQARKLWAGDTSENVSRFRDLLSKAPQSEFLLPQIIDLSLDPFSEAYKNQIEKLWTLIHSAGGGRNNEYSPSLHEQDAAYAACPIRFPGFLARRDDMAVRHAAYEYAMIADILLASDIKPGKRVIEYGAGSGNVAITLSRLGALVDTVDISETYCSHIRQNAEYYGTSLSPHNEVFGFNPRVGTSKYDAIIFHACFHHALDHLNLVAKLPGMLSEDGIIILSNEPILKNYYCPWGLRRDPESISVIAGRGWMELGFDLVYLTRLFYFSGLELVKASNNFSGVALYVARKLQKTNRFDASSCLSAAITDGHQAESDGLWTKGRTTIPLTSVFGSRHVNLEFLNHFPIDKIVSVETTLGKTQHLIKRESSSKIQVPIKASSNPFDCSIVIESQTHRPIDFFASSTDERAVGVFLTSLIY